MLIDENPVTIEDQKKFWNDELLNSRILLNALNKAILELTKDPKKAYNMDTGQTTINVSFHDLPSLYNQRKALLEQITELEDQLGLNKKETNFQGVPAW